MIVERITVNNIRTVIEMAKKFEDETSYVKVDVDHSVEKYTNLFSRGISGILALKTNSGKIVGGLGYIIAEDLHFPRLMAIETFWFVLPDYRGQGLKLFTEFENIAQERGCDYVAMIHLSDSHPESLEKLYKRKGYSLVEKHYVRRLA